MWIPHNLLSPLKAETPKPTIQASEAAKDERVFVVGFFLRNPVTRTAETDILVSARDGHRQVILDGKECTIDDCANASGKLEEIVYTFSSTGAVAALSACYRNLVARLDRLALQYGRGIEISGWRVADIDHGARWRCVPFRPSALLAEAGLESVPAAYGEILRLYRESRCTTSAAWRFICAGAIVDAAVAGRSPFTARLKGYDDPVITTDLLVRSSVFAFQPELNGATLGEFASGIEPKRKALLAGLLGQKGSEAEGSIGARGYQSDAAFAALANLVDLVARDIVLASLREGGHFAVAADIEDKIPENSGPV